MYEICALDIHSDMTIEASCTDLQYLLATGQAVDSFYYDPEIGRAEWWYCGKRYSLDGISYEIMTLATDRSGFCGYNYGCEKVDFYNAEGELILCYSDDECEFPSQLGDDIIRYLFMTGNKVWWIYDGQIRSIKPASGTERITLGFHSNLYVKEMNRLKDIVYNAFGEIVYLLERYPMRLTIGNTAIDIKGREVKPLILERYKLIAVCFIEDHYFTEITLYELDGTVHATIPLPEGTVAFHSVKLLEHTDIPVIAFYEELPDVTKYFNNGVAKSVRPNMPMKLRWYELLPVENGRYALYKSGELYQGFNDIDPFTLEEPHIAWR